MDITDAVPQLQDPAIPVLLAASTGGHLAQLNRLLGARSPRDTWVTFRTPQSEALLRDKTVIHIPYIAPRDAMGIVRGILILIRSLPRLKPQPAVCISTGSAIALAVFPIARLLKIPCIYIESVSRIDGPSLTGRVVARLRLARTFTQHAQWESAQWTAVDGVLQSYQPVPKTPSSGPLFITLGTIFPYRFDRLIDCIIRENLASSDTVWQLGASYDHSSLPGTSFDELSASEFHAMATKAGNVITHAGVGTILELLDAGIVPIVIPRRAEHGEHVDDHQAQIAKLVGEMGIAIVREADHVDEAALREAGSLRVVPR